jgi:hypothetical protein
MSCDRPEPLRSENAAGWLQNIRMLADLQDQIITCRRFASETSNPEQSRRLYQIANDIEQRARELGQRFLGSNHIRQPRRVCRTTCG